jgi:hypothetical protein
MDTNHIFWLIGTLAPLLGVMASIKQAADKKAQKKAALQTPVAQSIAQVSARAPSPFASGASIVPPVIARGPAAPARRTVTSGIGAVPIIAQPVPSAEGMLVSGLFTQPRSLVAAFVASEILGPPVAFRRH